ncbi:acyl-ACP--UDP-N-acetylglucosamine O-acyltransferase [Salaquimonas pukyongi]|uniref:acyl-ACP--UDP-N-acetylglucosamine O-acyltransferase n=1 Tax=Salaquimonas pukyongi TaxID=2712698 RepID=UPI00096B9C0D|nr:acyl-ACP--UDP-N-acetylglucosamine O-acyltransferase [Salaquimonas pukyongi]
MSSNIHASAIVEEGATLGQGVEIGPFCHVGPRAVLGDGVRLLSHAVVAGITTIGARTRIFPFASIGHEPQDLKFKGEETTLTIGTDCVIREGVTMNPGTAGDNSRTTIGDHCVFLANSHVAHDCVLGSHIIFSNGVMVAGHCKIDDYAILGGGAGVHQFCRIGRNAFVGGMAGVENDIIPFGVALGNRAYLGGLNLVGMKRAGIGRNDIHAARAAYKHLFSGSLPLAEAVGTLPEELTGNAAVKSIVEFIKAGADRALCTPRNRDELD